MEDGDRITLNKNVQSDGSADPQGQLRFACSFGERVHIVQDQNQSSSSRRAWKIGAKVLFEITLTVIGAAIPLFFDH